MFLVYILDKRKTHPFIDFVLNNQYSVLVADKITNQNKFLRRVDSPSLRIYPQCIVQVSKIQQELLGFFEDLKNEQDNS